MTNRQISPDAVLRRYHRLGAANRRRYAAATSTAPGTSERAAAVAAWRVWRERVRQIDARLWPLMVATGQGSTVF